MRNGQSYALSLNDLLQVLGGSSHQSYQVLANVPASLLPLKRGVFQAEVIIVGGQVVNCIVRDQANTIRLEGAKAFDAVRVQEQLIWNVLPYTPSEPSAPVQTVPFPASASQWADPSATTPSFPYATFSWMGRTPPVKVQASTPNMVASLEDRHVRLVWMLIDGKRTVAELSTLLQVSQEIVSNALTTLEARGLITSGPSQHERG